MKRKFEIFRERVYPSDTGAVRETIKTFKNEPEAISFFNDPRNQRRYGQYSMTKRDADGREYAWDERRNQWSQTT